MPTWDVAANTHVGNGRKESAIFAQHTNALTVFRGKGRIGDPAIVLAVPVSQKHNKIVSLPPASIGGCKLIGVE